MRSKRILTAIEIIGSILLILSLTGCGGSRPTATAEVVIATDQPTPILSVTPSATASPTLPIPTLPIPGAEVTPTDLPLIILDQPTTIPTWQPETNLGNRKILPAAVQIVEPGPDSKVASPINLFIKFLPSSGEQVLVQLIGEDGRTMAEKLSTIEIPKSGWATLPVEIPFEISTAGESALLVVSSRDEFGRRVAQTSIELLLLQIGKSDIEPTGFDREPFYLDSPTNSSVAKGGTVHIQGFVHPNGNGQIAGELVTESGGILESKVIDLPRDSDGKNFVPFSMDIPYSVAQRTPVRLILRQMDDRHTTVDRSLSSLIIYLDP